MILFDLISRFFSGINIKRAFKTLFHNFAINIVGGVYAAAKVYVMRGAAAAAEILCEAVSTFLFGK